MIVTNQFQPRTILPRIGYSCIYHTFNVSIYLFNSVNNINYNGHKLLSKYL